MPERAPDPELSSIGCQSYKAGEDKGVVEGDIYRLEIIPGLSQGEAAELRGLSAYELLSKGWHTLFSPYSEPIARMALQELLGLSPHDPQPPEAATAMDEGLKAMLLSKLVARLIPGAVIVLTDSSDQGTERDR